MIELDPTPTTKIAVAIDQGEIRTADGSAVEPTSEIALELKRGEPAVLYDLVLQFLKNAAIRIETRSKVERGYRLLRGAVDGPRAVRAEAVTLDRNMTVEAALQRFGQQCLRLLRWFAARGWRDQPISENATLLLAPISNVAPSVLERLHRKVRRRCKRFEIYFGDAVQSISVCHPTYID